MSGGRKTYRKGRKACRRGGRKSRRVAHRGGVNRNHYFL